MFQFSYCPLIWMFHSRAMEHKINRIHERTLRLIYPNQNQPIFKELLEEKQDLAYTRKTYQTLQLKFIRLKARSPLEIVNSLFEFAYKNYDLRNTSILKRKINLTVHYRSESLHP